MFLSKVDFTDSLFSYIIKNILKLKRVYITKKELYKIYTLCVNIFLYVLHSISMRHILVFNVFTKIQRIKEKMDPPLSAEQPSLI